MSILVHRWSVSVIHFSGYLHGAHEHYTPYSLRNRIALLGEARGVPYHHGLC